MNFGKSIRMFLVDGTPGGIITAEIINWTGHVVTSPRSRLPDLLRRPESERTGVYILIGDDPEIIGRSLVYIGETEDIGTRITEHARNEESGGKDFWNKVVLITSKDANLTKSHIRFLESRLIEIATRVDRAGRVNLRSPGLNSLPEADIADMESFIEHIRIILPVLGIDMLRESSAIRDPQLTQEGQYHQFEINSARHNLHAEAQEIDGEFIVKAGSQARGEWSGGAHGYQTLRQTLISENRLVPSEGAEQLIFAEDTVFKSPSAASAVIFGRPDNGRKSWMVSGSSQTYAEWQDAQVPNLIDQG